MPPISKTLGRHIGLGLYVRACVCLCARAWGTLCMRSRTVRDKILKLEICGIRMKNKRTRIFFFSVGRFGAELCPFFDVFKFYFAIIRLWDLVNKISGELLELGS